MNKVYYSIKDLKEDLKKNGEIVLEFSDEELKNEDTPNDCWTCCGNTSKGNRVLGMKIKCYDIFSGTPRYDLMIRYIIVS